MVLTVGMKIACLESQSTTMRMEVNLEDGRSCSMKSMEMEFQGFSKSEVVSTFHRVCGAVALSAYKLYKIYRMRKFGGWAIHIHGE